MSAVSIKPKRPPFGSIDSCAKCGLFPIGVQQTFGSRYEAVDAEMYTEPYRVADEWIERTCPRCSYVWQEGCVDQ